MNRIDYDFSRLPDVEMEAKPIDADTIEEGLLDGFNKYLWFLWGLLSGIVVGFGMVALMVWFGGGK